MPSANELACRTRGVSGLNPVHTVPLHQYEASRASISAVSFSSDSVDGIERMVQGEQPVRADEAGKDRRRRVRYPIELQVRYRPASTRRSAQDGTGRTINISSSGVLLTTDCFLPLGKRMELSISWPVKLDETIPLQLLVGGVVVRSDDCGAAVEIMSHEFQVCGTRRLGDPPPGAESLLGAE